MIAKVCSVAPARDHQRAADLRMDSPSIGLAHTNEDVMALFSRHRGLQSLPVLQKDGQPIGLINRNIFLAAMTKPYYREIYARKSCLAFMDKEPMIIEESMPIDTLSHVAVEAGDKVFSDGFIIVREGRYSGIGYGMDLMRALADLQQRRHAQVLESIEYASIIQHSFLRPAKQALEDVFAQGHFLVWEPRDLVGGDAFFFTRQVDGWLGVVFDCTGHGVPGAFMTLIAGAAFERALLETGGKDPGQLLAVVNRHVKNALAQHDSDTGPAGRVSNDGLDAAALRFDDASRGLSYAGARIPLIVLSPGAQECEFVTGERMGVGYAETAHDAQWTVRTLAVEPGTRLFLATDGVFDQIGGKKRIAFGKRRLGQCLLDGVSASMGEQKALFMDTFRAYQGQETRRDDVTLLGLTL